MAYEYPHIDVDRLFDDLQVTEANLQQVASLNIPTDIRVPSPSPIKTGTVKEVLHIMCPGVDFDVLAVKSPSDVEQPLGQLTIDCVLNRLANGMQIREEVALGESGAAWFSIENGLFKVAPQAEDVPIIPGEVVQGAVQFAEGADVSTTFDPNADYEDRAVAAVRLPGYPVVVQISPGSEAVTFPRDAILAAYNAEGGFDRNTAGSKLAEMGMVQDKQNPHKELTANRPGGPFTRQDQMARVIVRVLVGLAQL